MLTYVIVKRGKLIRLNNDDCSKDIYDDDIYKNKAEPVLVSLSNL